MYQPRHFVETREDALHGLIDAHPFEIAIERIEGKFKLSQNHPAANRTGVIAGLTRRAQGDDLALAALMQAQEEGRA
ncbi:hypothetical protein ACO2Q2_10500 [Dyella sp. KRB-257]|uniref:hypothetical protein n=1 Tax=Dyella sp. KRB-257 TaxID=3400915 RepID=UPI003C08E427